MKVNPVVGQETFLPVAVASVVSTLRPDGCGQNTKIQDPNVKKVSQKSPKNVPKTLRLELVKGYKKKITANKVGVSNVALQISSWDKQAANFCNWT